LPRPFVTIADYLAAIILGFYHKNAIWSQNNMVNVAIAMRNHNIVNQTIIVTQARRENFVDLIFSVITLFVARVFSKEIEGKEKRKE
jgi:hypothetical protein